MPYAIVSMSSVHVAFDVLYSAPTTALIASAPAARLPSVALNVSFVPGKASASENSPAIFLSVPIWTLSTRRAPYAPSALMSAAAEEHGTSGKMQSC